jgi:lipopolysaccharide export LptBFGC system permease protein LptF
MELIAMALLGFPVGLLISRRTAYLVIVGIFLFIYPYQTVTVYDAGDMHWSYVVVNAVALGIGAGLTTVGALVRERRAGRAGR